jgi:hypothetical protein
MGWDVLEIERELGEETEEATTLFINRIRFLGLDLSHAKGLSCGSLRAIAARVISVVMGCHVNTAPSSVLVDLR